MHGTGAHTTYIMLNLTLAFMVWLRTNTLILRVKLSNHAFKLTSLWTSYISFFNCDNSRLPEFYCWKFSANLLKRAQASRYFWP